jgi:hypothetical protein
MTTSDGCAQSHRSSSPSVLAKSRPVNEITEDKD